MRRTLRPSSPGDGSPAPGGEPPGDLWPAQMVVRLPANERGRDFIVGDIHGCYDAVIQGMREVRFDQKVDRIISVGDLIDRGEGSHRVLAFLRQPYVHAVRGNHDHQFCELDPEAIRVIGQLRGFGMGWVGKLSLAQIEEIRLELRKLPVVLEIPTERGLVGVVHGQPVPGLAWQEFTAAIERRDPAALKAAMEGRDRVHGEDMSIVPGVGRIYVGHTIVEQGARMFGNVVAVDTGAFLREMGKERGHLTMLNIVTRTQDLGAVVDQALGLRVVDRPGTGSFSTLGPAGGATSGAGALEQQEPPAPMPAPALSRAQRFGQRPRG